MQSLTFCSHFSQDGPIPQFLDLVAILSWNAPILAAWNPYGYMAIWFHSHSSIRLRCLSIGVSLERIIQMYQSGQGIRLIGPSDLLPIYKRPFSTSVSFPSVVLGLTQSHIFPIMVWALGSMWLRGDLPVDVTGLAVHLDSRVL